MRVFVTVFQVYDDREEFENINVLIIHYHTSEQR